MKKRLLLITYLFLLIAHHLIAQNHQLAGISYVFYPNTGLKDEARNVTFTFQEFGGFVKIPYKFKNEKTVLINGLSYACVNGVVNNTSTEFEGDNTEKLQVVTFQSIIAQKLKNNFNLVFSLRPTIASDFEKKLSSDDFVMQGFVFVSKKKNENLSIGLGVANTMRLGETFVLPIMPFTFKRNKHNINAIFPLKLDYTYCVDKKERLKLGFREIANGGNINITASYSSSKNIPEIDKVNYSRINIGPVVYYNITKFIQFEATGGVSLRRHYNLLDIENNKQEMYLKNAPFFQFGIFLTPPKRM